MLGSPDKKIWFDVSRTAGIPRTFARTVKDNFRSGFSQAQANGQSNTFGGAGDQRGLNFQGEADIFNFRNSECFCRRCDGSRGLLRAATLHFFFVTALQGQNTTVETANVTVKGESLPQRNFVGYASARSAMTGPASVIALKPAFLGATTGDSAPRSRNGCNVPNNRTKYSAIHSRGQDTPYRNGRSGRDKTERLGFVPRFPEYPSPAPIIGG